MLAVDLSATMPWWAASAGPSVAALGIVIVLLDQRASYAGTSVP
jgi:hypothetical protein